MFTGLVEEVGEVISLSGDDQAKRLVIATQTVHADAALGDSIAIDGCCMTVVEVQNKVLAFEAGAETLKRTTIGQLTKGASVNLERALAAGQRLGGHFVLGHVDGVGHVASLRPQGDSIYFSVKAPPDVARLCAPRGSITVAGVSLTVTSAENDGFTVNLIPHTLVHTTLGKLAVGDAVNLEADVLARYVANLRPSI